VDFRSETFQKAYKDLISIPNLNQDIAVSYLKEKNIDPVEFKIANKNFSDFKLSGKEVRPEGFALGRIAGRMLGEAGEDIKDIGTMIAPKTTEAISQFASDIIPDAAEDYMDRMFDPYMGEGTGSEVSRVTADIGSFFLPGKAIKYGIKGGKVVMGGKQATAIGPKAQQTKKFKDRLENYGSYATGYTIAEDSADENTYNAMLDLADEYGGLKGTELSNLLNKFAINPNDSEVVQKLNSLALNLSGVGMFAGLAKLKTPMDRAKALELIKKKKDKAKKQQLAIDVAPTTLLGKAADKVGIRNRLYRGFSTTRGTDKFTRDRILKRESAVKRTLKEVDGLAQDLTKTIDNAQTSLNTDQLTLLVNGVLNGEQAALRTLLQEAPDVARIAREMAKNIREARKPIAGRIKNAKVKAMYDPNKKKVWLNRSYRIYDDPSFSREIKNISPDVRAGVEKYLRRIGIPENKMEGAIKKLLARGNLSEKTIGDVFNPFRKTGSTGIGSSSKVYKPRTKLADVKEVRALWGEVKDPYKNYMNSMVKLSRMEADASFLDDIAKYLKENGLAKTADQIENRSGPIVGDWSDFEKGLALTGTKVQSLEKFGADTLKDILGKDAEKLILNPLEGLYANKNYRNFLQEGTDVLGPTSDIGKAWMMYKVATQTSKTIYNPGTHGRNTLGNKILLVANGMNPFGYKKEGFQAAAEKLTGKSNKELGKRLGRYQELGITESGVKQEIIRRAANQVFNFDSKTVAGKVQQAMNKKSNPIKAAQNLYQVEDDFFKIMHFENTINSLKKVFPKGTPIEVIEEEAARRTRDLMPNYNLVGKSLKEARKLPVGDFMAFPAEMIRISKNLARDTYDDIRGNTAARLGIKNKEAQKQLKNMGYKRLAGMTATATAGDQLGNYSANLMGITGEDQESLQRLQPTWEQGTAKIYLSDFNKDKNNHLGIDYINLGPIDPFSYFKAPVKLLAKELADITEKGIRTGQVGLSEDFNRRLGAAFMQIGGPFGGTSMSTEAIIKAMNVYDDDRLNFKEKLLEGGSILGSTILPGGFTMGLKGQKYRTSKKLRKGMYNPQTGEYEDRGAVSDYDYTIPEVEMEGLLGKARWLGIRPQRLDITAGMRRQIFPLIKDMDRSDNQVKFMTNPNSPRDPALRSKQFMNAYKKDQLKRLDKQRDLKKIVDAYEELGLDYEDILSGVSREFFKNINSKDIISKMDFANRNKFFPSYIPQGQIAEAEGYTGGALPYDDVGQLYEQLFNYNLVDED